MSKIRKPSLLDAGSGRSMMRWATMALIILSLFLGISGMIIQAITAWKGNDLDWTGFSLFIGSVTTLAGAAITGKWAQKKVEARYDSNNRKNQIEEGS